MQATAKEVKLPPVKKGKKNFSVFPFVNGLFFLLFCLFILVPLWKVLVDSLDLTTGYGMKLWPENFGLAGYQSVFSNPTLLRPLMISVVTTVAGTFLGLFLSTVGAYVLIQWDMPGRNFFAGIMLFTMIFQGGMIPTYLVMKNLHLTNTLWVVILMPAINIYNLVLMRNFFEGIPVRVRDAGRLLADSDFLQNCPAAVQGGAGVHRSDVRRLLLERLHQLQALHHHRPEPVQLPDEAAFHHHGF